MPRGFCAMTMACIAYAYLVRSCRMTASGDVVSEPDTICFDCDLALQMARDERRHAAGTAVYALGYDGDLIADSPLASHGLSIPPPYGCGAAVMA